MASESIEERFKSELLRCYEESKKYLFPKAEYYRRIGSIKSSSVNSHMKSRSDYYLLSKYEVLKCGDVEKLIKNGQMQTSHPCIM
ncbi:uncharacterized protein LOC119588412 isoform X2 [Penaeus monodon]|uniref:uncharacterized protein LOC119588412 isoform X2 n=1 Tax=Penaeus monodon TaxID=6687 RepID=UPI0018A6EB37|nr:uncharacterized protein LOC119588412 isoform X2 [Penaeus monodon]